MLSRTASPSRDTQQDPFGAGKVFCIDGVSPRKLQVLQRRGLSADGEARLFALDARTGDVVWETGADVFGTFLSYSADHDVLLQAGSAYRDRAWDEVIQADDGGQSYDNRRSVLYEYDALSRLIGAQMGVLDDDGGMHIDNPVRQLTWDLDPQSNWTQQTVGEWSLTSSSTPPEIETIVEHTTDARNELSEVFTERTTGPPISTFGMPVDTSAVQNVLSEILAAGSPPVSTVEEPVVMVLGNGR